MTRVAEPWCTYFEQPVIDGTVGFMAVGTIFEDRLMLPEKGASFLRMAGVTVLVHAGLFELGRIGRAMRIMAIRTGNLSFL